MLLGWSGIMKFIHLKNKKFYFFQRIIRRKYLNTYVITMGAHMQKQKCREVNEQSREKIHREENIEKYFRPSC